MLQKDSPWRIPMVSPPAKCDDAPGTKKCCRELEFSNRQTNYEASFFHIRCFSDDFGCRLRNLREAGNGSQCG